MIPGVGHCSGGAGPDTVDWLAALESWVEKGTAPVQIPASKIVGGKTTFTRPLCVYQVYKGSGDINDAANLTCGHPK